MGTINCKPKSVGEKMLGILGLGPTLDSWQKHTGRIDNAIGEQVDGSAPKAPGANCTIAEIKGGAVAPKLPSPPPPQKEKEAEGETPKFQF